MNANPMRQAMARAALARQAVIHREEEERVRREEEERLRQEEARREQEAREAPDREAREQARVAREQQAVRNQAVRNQEAREAQEQAVRDQEARVAREQQAAREQEARERNARLAREQAARTAREEAARAARVQREARELVDLERVAGERIAAATRNLGAGNRLARLRRTRNALVAPRTWHKIPTGLPADIVALVTPVLKGTYAESLTATETDEIDAPERRFEPPNARNAVIRTAFPPVVFPPGQEHKQSEYLKRKVLEEASYGSRIHIMRIVDSMTEDLIGQLHLLRQLERQRQAAIERRTVDAGVPSDRVFQNAIRTQKDLIQRTVANIIAQKARLNPIVLTGQNAAENRSAWLNRTQKQVRYGLARYARGTQRWLTGIPQRTKPLELALRDEGLTPEGVNRLLASSARANEERLAEKGPRPISKRVMNVLKTRANRARETVRNRHRIFPKLFGGGN